jgi:hypothetical protein
LDMQLDAIAIRPRFARDRFNFALERHLADPLQRLAQDDALLFHLKSVIGMLIMAASAALKIRARSADAIRRRFQNFRQTAAPQIILNPTDFRAHLLAGKHVGREHNFAFETGQAIAAVNKFFYRQIFFGGQAGSSPYGNMGVKK